MKKEQPVPLVDVINPSPKLGDKKQISKFAFLPVRIITDNDTESYVWLRKYIEVYEYQIFTNLISINYPYKDSYNRVIEYNDWNLIIKKV